MAVLSCSWRCKAEAMAAGFAAALPDVLGG